LRWIWRCTKNNAYRCINRDQAADSPQ